MSAPSVNFVAGLVACCLAFAATLAIADPESAPAPKDSLTAQAGDPTAPLAQIQLTYLYSDVVRNSSGDTRQLQFEPVIPIPPNAFGPWAQILRPTVPFVDVPDGRSGLGDIQLQHVFVPEKFSWGTIGYGYTATLPTAQHRELGQGKYQLGPALTVVCYGVRNWQLGATVTQSWSVAGESERRGVSSLTIQPIINYLYGDWYIGIGDFTWSYDFKDSEGWTIPLGLQVGKIVRIGRYNYNLSAEMLWVPRQDGDGAEPERGVKLGFVWLLPE